MQKTATILASALLLGYLITELSVRFFPQNFMALLSIAVLGFVLHGFFIARQTQTMKEAAAPDRDQSKRADELTTVLNKIEAETKTAVSVATVTLTIGRIRIVITTHANPRRHPGLRKRVK